MYLTHRVLAHAYLLRYANTDLSLCYSSGHECIDQCFSECLKITGYHLLIRGA